MLDDDDRIAEVAQIGERTEQALVVALVQSDRRLVEHIHDADQAGADLAGEADALGFAAGERVGATIERQIIETDVDEEFQALVDFTRDFFRDLAAAAGQGERAEKRVQPPDRHRRQLGQDAVLHENMARRFAQARAAALRADAAVVEFGQFLAHDLRVGLAVAPLHVGDDALEGVAAFAASPAFVEVGEFDELFAAAVQNDLAQLRRQRLERRIDVEAVMGGEGVEQLGVIAVAQIPAAYRAGGEAELGMANDPRRVEEFDFPEAVAGRAGAGGVVEREQPRFQFAQAVAALRAGVKRGKHQIGAPRLVHEGDAHRATAHLQRGFQRFGQALLVLALDAEAVDQRFDHVLALRVERRRLVEIDDFTVDACADETLCAQIGDELQMAALAILHQRREQHQPRALGQGEDVIDHLADRLRGELDTVRGAARFAGAGIQQAQVVVDFGHRADGRARVVRNRFLFDRDGGRQAVDVVDVRLFHDRQELARVARQRFDIASLALGVNGIESERGLARAGQPGDHDQAGARQIEIDVLEIVRPRTADGDFLHRNSCSKGNLLIYASCPRKRKETPWPIRQ